MSAWIAILNKSDPLDFGDVIIVELVKFQGIIAFHAITYCTYVLIRLFVSTPVTPIYRHG